MTARLEQLIESLLARGHRGMVLGLDRTLAALARLGRPHERLDAIVVAGSNGKGSVSSMLERIGREAGLRTGLYTSPHLSRYNERIRFDGIPIDDLAFEEALSRVFRDAPDDLTFFETLTLAAFVAFRERHVDLAILEVGLGGRLDSTNVVPEPLATAIVSITSGEGGRHLEHADLLGATVAEIAYEKAGILRHGVPLVIGPLEDEARSVIAKRARDLNAHPTWEIAWSTADGSSEKNVERGVLADNETGSLVLPDGTRYVIAPSLIGRHQVANGAVAAATAHLASARLPAMRGAIESGVSLATWPGRFERVDLEERGISVWLDCAHNLDGARALVAAWPSVRVDVERTTLVFGALADKAYEPFLRLVSPLASRRFYTEPGGRAPASLDELSLIAEGERAPAPKDALERALAVTPRGGAVLVTGSIYLVGTVRAELFRERRDPPIGL